MHHRKKPGTSYLNTATLCTTFWIVIFFTFGPDIFGDPDGVSLSTISYLLQSSGYIGSCKEECGRVRMDHFNPTSVIRILSWTPLSLYFNGPWHQEGSSIFDECGFDPDMKCEYTHDRSMFYVSDAVLFKGIMLSTHPPPPDHPSHQKWVFFETKPPRLTTIIQNLTAFRNIFNLTSTYSRDSDLPTPFIRKCTPIQGELNIQAYPTENFARKKSRLVAWVNVNLCQTPSRRENYVNQLQKYVQVDIYGHCGNYRCDSKWDFAKCLERVSAKYKFVLAFENVLCRDYISDVMWSVFDHRLKIVPVVLGGGDYSNSLPPGTFIDVRDFPSPLSLANYLKHLDRDDDLYNAFLWRRVFDRCHFTTDYSQYHCALCKHLHLHRGSTEYTLDVKTFWSNRKQCTAPAKFYKNIAKDIFADDSPSKAWGTL